MPGTVRCPHCGAQLRYSGPALPARGRCPTCKSVFSTAGFESAFAEVSRRCRTMGDEITKVLPREGTPREWDALLWSSTIITGFGGTTTTAALHTAQEVKGRLLPEVEGAGQRCLGAPVRIIASPANGFWTGGRRSSQVGRKGKLIDFRFSVVAYRRGFSGARFTIELEDGERTPVLIEEIELCESPAS